MYPPAGFEQARRRLRTLARIASLLALVAVLATLFRSQLLTGLARYLIVEDALHPADIAFVLNGDVEGLAARASDLYHRALVPSIAIARAQDTPTMELGLSPNPTDLAVGLMMQRGVPTEAISVLPGDGGVTNMRDEALALRRYVESQPIDRVILVVSAFRSRRARWTFEKQLSATPIDLEVAPTRHWLYDETNWWRSELGLMALANEYLLLFYHLIH